MLADIHATKVNLDGLMEVLGRHLYSTPAVVVRELVQNAHDSCERRRLEAGQPFEARIRVRTGHADGCLIIEDSGAGMTRDEIQRYLATVGSGYTRLLRERRPESGAIGFFGLGFLSAYVVSNSVDVWTTSYQEPMRGWHFASNGVARYTVEETAAGEVGTRVVLRLADDFRDLADPRTARDLLTHYCRLLPVPVWLDDDEEPLNGVPPPWRSGDAERSPLALKKAGLDFAREFEHRFEPLCAFGFGHGDGSGTSALLWIQDGSTYGGSDNRNVSVFVRGMLVTDTARELLPAWAGFVGAVIESDRLLPTASREDIQRDEGYREVQEQLAEALVAGLKDYARNEPATWRQILSRHNEALLGAAVSDERLFEVLDEQLKVPTSEGEMTLPQAVELGKGQIYLSTDDGSAHEDIVLRAMRIPVVNGFRYAVRPFCRRYADKHGTEIVVLGTRAGQARVFSSASGDKAADGRLLELLARENQEVVLTSFQPDYLPLVLVADQEYELKQRLESDEADRRISQAVLGLARRYTQSISASTPLRLYVNRESGLIRQLLNAEGTHGATLARLLLSFTYLIAGHGGGARRPLDDEWRQFTQSAIELMNPERAE